MPDYRYTKDHEWVTVDAGVATVGITDYAQEQLGDIVYVELPDVGRAVTAGEEVAVVESVKAASEIYAPLSGRVTKVNSLLLDSPGAVNEDATCSGWFLRIEMSNPGEVEQLLDDTSYGALIDGA